MELLQNYSIEYCGKCADGYVKTVLPSGEEVLTACECKLKNDSEFIYHSLIKNSHLQYTTFNEYNFDNPEKFIQLLMVDKHTPEVYKAIFNNFFKHTATKFVSVPQLIKYIYGDDLMHSEINFAIINNSGFNQATHFFSQFLLNIILKRLVPARIASFHEIQGIYTDLKKYDINNFTQGFKIIILTQLFCDDMIDAMKNDYKYERINKFLFELYNTDGIAVYVFTDKYISAIRDINTSPKVAGDKTISGRVNSIMDLILNKSKTVLTQL